MSTLSEASEVYRLMRTGVFLTETERALLELAQFVERFSELDNAEQIEDMKDDVPMMVEYAESLMERHRWLTEEVFEAGRIKS